MLRTFDNPYRSINSIPCSCFASAFGHSSDSILCPRISIFSTISGNLLLARSKPRSSNYIGSWYSFGTAGFERKVRRHQFPDKSGGSFLNRSYSWNADSVILEEVAMRCVVSPRSRLGTRMASLPEASKFVRIYSTAEMYLVFSYSIGAIGQPPFFRRSGGNRTNRHGRALQKN
jgi:hypothetical protein